MHTKKVALLFLSILAFAFIFGYPQFAAAEDTDNDHEEDVEDTEDDEDGSDEDGDGAEDDVEESNERKVEVNIDDDGQVEIQSELENGEQEDKIKIQIAPEDEGLRVKLEYSQESESSEVELDFKVEFRDLFEFEDTNANGFYEPDIDTKVQEFSLNSWQAPFYEEQSAIDGTIIHYIRFTTTDGVFILHLYAPENFVDLDGTTVTPTEVKINIEIINFGYLSGSSQLALSVRLESESSYESEEETEDEAEGYSENEEGVQTTEGDTTGIFTWAETAMVDGVEKPVVASPIDSDDEDANKQRIFLNYPRGTHIIHDPRLGVEGILELPAASGIGIDMSFYIIAFAAVASLLLIARKRRSL